MGRPSSFTQEIADDICERLINGESLRTISNQDGMPHPATICRWLDANLAFRERYSRARELQADILAAETLTLADTCRMGEKIERKEIGRFCSICSLDVQWLRGAWRHSEDGSDLCAGAEAEKLCEEKVSTGDMVERSRLQIDARKWYAGKLAPKKYGDTHQVNVDMTAQISAVSVTLGQSLGLEELEALRAKLLAAAAPAPKQLTEAPASEHEKGNR